MKDMEYKRCLHCGHFTVIEGEGVIEEPDRAEKCDEGKLRYDLIPVYALEKVAEVYAYGAKKYSDNNWRRGVEYSRSYGSIMRHLQAWWGGEDNDVESQCPHLAAVVFHCLAVIQRHGEGVDPNNGLDDRL